MATSLGTPSRVVLVTPNERVAAPVAHILRSAGHHVVELAGLVEAERWLRQNRAELAAVDLDAISSSGARNAGDAVEILQSTRPDMKSLLLVHATPEACEQLQTRRLHNLLAIDRDGTVDPLELVATVCRMLRGGRRDESGLASYLAARAHIEQKELAHSDACAAAIEWVEAFAREQGCNRHVASALGLAADELLTNAFYNAPVDAAGTRLFASRPRTTPVVLPGKATIRLELGSDGRRLGIAICDPYGSLPSTTVHEYLARCFAGGEHQIEQKEGGAGLGLYTLFQHVEHFCLDLAPGSYTEAIGLVAISRSFRAHQQRTKSFNLFLSGT